MEGSGGGIDVKQELTSEDPHGHNGVKTKTYDERVPGREGERIRRTGQLKSKEGVKGTDLGF
jgi:hypothetical protein